MLMYLETATAISYRNIFLLLLLRGVNFLTLKTYLHASVQVGIITCQCFLQRLRFCCEFFFFFLRCLVDISGCPSHVSCWKRIFPRQHASPLPRMCVHSFL